MDKQDLRVADQRDETVDRPGVLAQSGIGLVGLQPGRDRVDLLPERADPT
jgi:hypothetical protein